MAFNITAHFRKHRQIWMVGILFVTMVTFVLCTGRQSGGLEDILMNWSRYWRGGKTVAKIDGRNITDRELEELKKHREIANDFMRAALGAAAKNAEEILRRLDDKIKEKEAQQGKDAKDTDELKKLVTEKKFLQNFHDGLQARLTSKARFFDTGTKLDDLLNFILLRDEADRQNVTLVEKHVKDMIEWEVAGYLYQVNNVLASNKMDTFYLPFYWNQELEFRARSKVKETHHEADYPVILAALKDEFRVQIVQYALLGYPGAGGEMLADVKKFGYPTRIALTPHQLWQEYKRDMTRFDIYLLPVPIDHKEFVSKVPEPSEGILESLFKEGQKNPHNPGSDRPGFQQPQKAKIQYITANPDSEYYKNLGKLATALAWNPPGFVDLGTGALGTMTRQVGSGAFLDSFLDETYYKADQKMRPSGMAGDFIFRQVPLTDPDFELPLYKSAHDLDPNKAPTPQMVTGLLGSVAMPGGGLAALGEGLGAYEAGAYYSYKEAMAPALQAEVERRLKVATKLFLSGTGPSKYPVLGALQEYLLHQDEPVYLPFPAVKQRYLARLEKAEAASIANHVMEDVRSYLEKGQGNKKEFMARLEELKDKYQDGLEIGQSERLDDQYDVAKDPGLAKLRNAFEEPERDPQQEPKILNLINYFEGRAGTDNKVTVDDFHKLFFDPSESFSIGASSPYNMQQWPPQVTAKKDIRAEQMAKLGGFGEAKKNVKFNLGKFSDHHFLFWKTESHEQKHPEKLADAGDLVRKAYTLQEARKLALERAKEIASSLSKKEPGDRLGAMEAEAAKLDVKLIPLKDQAKKVKTLFAQSMDQPPAWKYELTKLPKDLIPYPRASMSKEVYSLYGLKDPISYWDSKKPDDQQEPGSDKDLDNLNSKELFPKSPPREGVEQPVQVLTNKPRSVYYVAVVAAVFPASEKDFFAAYAKTKGGGEQADLFVPMAHADKGVEFREIFIQQLRAKHQLKIEDASAFAQ
jgi:hypothetical protein